MKRKIGLALAVILVGVLVVVYAQTKGEKVEPTSTPVSSSVSVSSAPVATEEPAETPEPSPSSQPVNQEVVDHGESTEGEEPVNETEEDYNAAMDAYWEQQIQSYMNDFNMSREEAESWVQGSKDQAAASQAEVDKNRQEYEEQWQAEHDKLVAEGNEKNNQELLDRYGITLEEWENMTSDEQFAWTRSHQK